MRNNLILLLAVLPLSLMAQFAPEAGMPGSTAIHADSTAFVGWATGCTVERGWQQIGNEGLGFAAYGSESDAVGKADNMVVSLGDGGVATVTFASSIVNDAGPDFAVFENAFHTSPHVFLELAFVEVSSDGEHFFRFPAVSNVPADSQVGSFDVMDASMIHNFAGKYEVFYGTPFDLDDLEDDILLNKNDITHVRLIDVVGNINPEYATCDSEGHLVNDPWPTPFASSGFDLDAVGVIHDVAHQSGVDDNSSNFVRVYPNPTTGLLTICSEVGSFCEIYNLIGQTVKSFVLEAENAIIDLGDLNAGLYFVRAVNHGKVRVEMIVKQ